MKHNLTTKFLEELDGGFQPILENNSPSELILKVIPESKFKKRIYEIYKKNSVSHYITENAYRRFHLENDVINLLDNFPSKDLKEDSDINLSQINQEGLPITDYYYMTLDVPMEIPGITLTAVFSFYFTIVEDDGRSLNVECTDYQNVKLHGLAIEPSYKSLQALFKNYLNLGIDLQKLLNQKALEITLENFEPHNPQFQYIWDFLENSRTFKLKK